MKRLHEPLLYEAANLICWYRILLSVGLCFVPVGRWLCVIPYSLALVSDVWDGWCYRRFTESRPYQHCFNRLPITMDPIADFVFVGGGLIHIAEDKVVGIIVVVITAAVLVIWQIIARTAPSRWVYHVMNEVILTYGWFAMMLVTTAMVWYRDAREIWFPGFVATLVVFYACYFRTRRGGKSRK